MFGAIKTFQILLSKPNAVGWAVTYPDLLVQVLMKKYYELLPRGRVTYGYYTPQRGFKNKIIIFDNNSILRFKSYDQDVGAFQGADLDVAHLDEECPNPEIVKEVKARLIDKGGTLVRTMTPLMGLSYTYEEIQRRLDEELEVFRWESDYNIYVPKEELLRIVNQFPEKEREARLKGHFINLKGNLCYYNFSAENLIKDYVYNPNITLEIGCDFNIDLMAWTVSQNIDGSDYVFDIIEQVENANTWLMCQKIKEKFSEHKSDIIFYLDFSANQRRPESSYTNYEIIKSEFPNAIIRTNKIKNIKDRIDAVNLRLKDNEGRRWLFIKENLFRLTNDFNQVTWDLMLNKNRAGLLTHCSDALSYMIFDKYSIRNKFVTKTKIY